MARIHVAIFLALAAGSLGCTLDEEPTEHHALDFEELDGDGKADGAFDRFDQHRLVSDDAFFDPAAMSVADVQGFLEATPYGARSFLADERVASGAPLSSAIVEVAGQHGLNPLVLLVTLQKERGLVSRRARPSQRQVDYAFGCGCADNRTCSPTYRGIDRQLACAARVLRDAADRVDAGETTVNGYAPGLSTRVLDGVRVTPRSKATAVLYTYTPWIARGTGGNWLFWNIWRRYASALGYDRGLSMPFNEGFIGGACSDDADCYYDGGICLAGVCSRACTSTCPDLGGAYAPTLCVTAADGGGACVAECDPALTATGCGDGQVCQPTPRHGDPTVTRDVCLP